jgi:hypothetical protein
LSYHIAILHCVAAENASLRFKFAWEMYGADACMCTTGDTKRQCNPNRESICKIKCRVEFGVAFAKQTLMNAQKKAREMAEESD